MRSRDLSSGSDCLWWSTPTADNQAWHRMGVQHWCFDQTGRQLHQKRIWYGGWNRNLYERKTEPISWIPMYILTGKISLLHSIFSMNQTFDVIRFIITRYVLRAVPLYQFCIFYTLFKTRAGKSDFWESISKAAAQGALNRFYPPCIVNAAFRWIALALVVILRCVSPL